MEAAAMRYVHNPAAFVRARQVKLLLDGRQAYPEMLAAIANATRSVDMGTYILRADRTGHRFAAALIAAAQRGVTVRLVYDGVGGMDLPQQYVNELLQGGVAVAVYRPISSLWLRGFGAINRRDHRKILVVDGTTAFTGGMNIGDEQAAKEDGGEGWRDTHCRVDGKEPAQQFLALLERGWQRADKFPPCSQTPGVHAAAVPAEGASALAANSVQCAAVSSDVSVQVLGNKEFIQRLRVRQAYLHAIKNAKRYILIENAYFIPDRRIRRALRAAVKRGVAVGVVTPMYSDLRIVAMASRALYGELLASGVRLFEYPISMLHCKAAVIDDLWSVVSSYNLDHRSLLHNLEAGVLLVDREIAQALRKQIVIDIANCREVTLELQKARPWNEALAESLAYQARYWL
jgi:cardiolipin synthase